jgi:hypothetical protein
MLWMNINILTLTKKVNVSAALMTTWQARLERDLLDWFLPQAARSQDWPGSINRSTPISTSATPTGRAGLATTVFYPYIVNFNRSGSPANTFQYLIQPTLLIGQHCKVTSDNILVSRHRHRYQQHLRTTHRLDWIYLHFLPLPALSRIFTSVGLNRPLHTSSTATQKSHHGADYTSKARRFQPGNCWHI